MSHYELYSSPSYQEHVNVPKLPVYLRSVGHKILDDGVQENVPELRSPFYEMIWCVRGSGEALLYQEKFLLSANDIFFYHPNERHILHSLSQGWDIYWFAFDGPVAASFFDGFGYPRKMHTSEPFPVALFEEIRNEIADIVPAVFRKMLARLCEILALAGGVDRSENSLISNALHIIRDNFADPGLNVNTLAEQLQVHRSTLVSLFRTQYGHRPSRVIHMERMFQAKTLLANTTLPVREVAAKCGIPEPSSFCRVFLKATGTTPAKYRETFANGEEHT